MISTPRHSGHPYRRYAALFAISAASLMFELALTRVYAVAQGHHFAFMAIAMALLGIGLSGALLAATARLRNARPDIVIGVSGAGFAVTAIGAYVTADRIPFDAYRIGVETGQLGWLALYFLVAGVPFVFAGLAVIVALRAVPGRARTPYFVNLVGAAAGAALAIVAVRALGALGTTLMSAAIAGLAVPALTNRRATVAAGLLAAAGLAVAAVLVAPVGPRMSPYADLQQILQRPGARLQTTHLSASSQIDVVANGRVRSAQGLSLGFRGEVPTPRLAVTVDGANAAPLDIAPGEYLEHVPLAAAVRLRSAQTALLIDPIGGFEVAVLTRHGVADIQVVQPDPALVAAWRAGAVATPFTDPRVQVRTDGVRSALGSASNIGLLVWPLRESFRGVSAGAFSIRETFAYTVEAFTAGLRALAPDGVLVITRWLQATPSESVRAWSTLAHALRQVGIGSPERHMLAWRSIQVATVVASPAPFTDAEIDALDAALAADRFDWIYRPGLSPQGANRFNVLPNDALFASFDAILSGDPPPASGFDAAPTTDDRPFFFHFFRWDRTGEVMATLGRTWQPFGGAGFLALIPLAALAIGLTLVVVIFPVAAGRDPAGRWRSTGRLLVFALIGAGYVLAQIPALQRLILIVDAPTNAFALGLAAILGWTGIGALTLGHRTARVSFYAVSAAAAIAVEALLLQLLASTSLGLPLWARALAAVLALAPLGIALGSVFPSALTALGASRPAIVPWAWAANGVASVVGALAAAIVGVTFGLNATLAAGAGAYLIAAALWRATRPGLGRARPSAAQS